MNKFKYCILLFSFICVSNVMFSQVGINTENPAATFDIVAGNTGASTAEGFIAPRLTGAQLASKNAQYGLAQDATIVYVTDADPAAANKTRNVTSAGYYFYDAKANNGSGANSGLWTPLSGDKRQQFYMPSVVLPTNGSNLPDATNYSYSNGTFTVNLFDIYRKQYATPQVKSLSSATLSVGATAANFDYFVLYFDPAVFSSVDVSASGQLSYTLVSNYTISEKTFMNIMFKEK